MFISCTVYLNPVIVSMNGKPRSIREKNAIQLSYKPVLVCACPINMIYGVTTRQNTTNIWTTCTYPTLAQANAHSLGRYTVVMCTMGISSSSCGSLEAIAQVGVPNIAVSAKRHDAWTTSTTWWIFRTPCCLKMLPKVSNSMRRTSNIHSNSIHCHTSIKHTNGLHKFCRILGLLKIKKTEKKKVIFSTSFS